MSHAEKSRAESSAPAGDTRVAKWSLRGASKRAERARSRQKGEAAERRPTTDYKRRLGATPKEPYPVSGARPSGARLIRDKAGEGGAPCRSKQASGASARTSQCLE